MPAMGHRELVETLEELAELLRTRRTTARIYIVGGAAMAMAYGSDRFTHDIDALILDNHTAVTQAVEEVARRRGLPTSWLNEQATAYMPKGDDVHSRVVFDHPGLRVTAASPERMLAMKVRAARVTDIPDLLLLVDILGYTTPEQVKETALTVFGNEPLPQRSTSTIATLFT